MLTAILCAILIGIRPQVCYGEGKATRRLGKIRICPIGADPDCCKIRGQSFIPDTCVIRELLWVILISKKPGEPIVVIFTEPVQLVGEIGIGTVIHSE